MAETLKEKSRRMAAILRILHREYPEAHTSLVFRSPYELLISTILSAQCTDERVNQVTPGLFKRFPGPQEMAMASRSELEKIIQSTGFFHSKARSIQEASEAIVREHGGQVPRTLEELCRLRGVGRKTANVVLGNAWGVPALVVDTHVGRLVIRMGFSRSKNPVQVEQEMMKIVAESEWTNFAHLLILHGRAICTARRAFCEKCPVQLFCPKVGVAQNRGLGRDSVVLPRRRLPNRRTK